ncbi:MAG: RNA 2',3'-cyclic phosphodiesterase [Candidatus Omnitrophota bacterium]
MPENLRLFIAVELGSPLREQLAEIQKELKKSGADAKWVKPENIHLTLKFLGATASDKVESISNALQEIALLTPGFSATASQLGAFPKIEYPRVIWVGISEGKTELENLGRKIEDRLFELGFSREERPFAAHLTLARIRSPLNRQSLVEKLKQAQFPAQTQLIREIILFKSTLTPKGPIYEALKRITLKAS